MKPTPAAATFGAVWGLFATLAATGLREFGLTALAYAVSVGPLVGVGIYWTSRWAYSLSRGVRIAWSVATVFLGAFALYVPALLLAQPSESALGAVASTVTGVAWLLFVPLAWPVFAVLFVAAYLNHEGMRRLSGLDDPPASAV
jgi:hypothetical protein